MCSPISTTTCGRPCSARPSCSSRASSARTAASLDLLTADYTFVNERLARHYGIPNIYGSQFRRVTVTDDTRRGLLGHGSILTVTSYAEPDLAGDARQVVLTNLLGTPPPPPPPNVPPLDENAGQAADRARADGSSTAQNPACASCHKLMDPIGFALENFDGIGRWRTTDDGAADRRVRHALGRRRGRWPGRAAAGDPQPVPSCSSGRVTEKLLTYALGRGLEYYDMPVVRAIVQDAARTNYRFSSLVLGIVDERAVSDEMKAQEAHGAQH